jgi:chromosome segregation ATPase
MPIVSDSYNRAYDACDVVLIEEGRFPTVEAIRARIGTNSPAIIKRAINDWLLNFAKQHKERIHRPELPAALLDAVDNIWKTATDQSQKLFDTASEEFRLRETELESHIAFITNTMNQQKVDWLEKEKRYDEQISQQQLLLESHQKELANNEATLLRVRDQLAETQQKLGCADATILELRKYQENQMIEWKERAEQAHEWHLKRIGEEKDSLRMTYETQLEKLSKKLQSESIENESQKIRLTQLMSKVENFVEILEKKNNEISDLKIKLTGTDNDNHNWRIKKRLDIVRKR